jgi:hypothetical protein
MQSSARVVDVRTFSRVRFPVIFYRNSKRQSCLTLDMSRIRNYFQLSEQATDLLSQVFSISVIQKQLQPMLRNRLDYQTLALQYKQMIDDGSCKNWSEVAKHFGVSRAWVTKVLKKSRCFNRESKLIAK